MKQIATEAIGFPPAVTSDREWERICAREQAKKLKKLKKLKKGEKC